MAIKLGLLIIFASGFGLGDTKNINALCMLLGMVTVLASFVKAEKRFYPNYMTLGHKIIIYSTQLLCIYLLLK